MASTPNQNQMEQRQMEQAVRDEMGTHPAWGYRRIACWLQRAGWAAATPWRVRQIVARCEAAEPSGQR